MVMQTTIERLLEPSGLILRGGFHPARGDGVPSGAATLLLIGNALWRKEGPVAIILGMSLIYGFLPTTVHLVRVIRRPGQAA